MHIVDGDQRHLAFARQLLEAHQPGAVLATMQHAGCQPHATGRDGAQAGEQRLVAAECDQFQSERMCDQIVERENAFTLFAAQIAEREQAREPAPAGAVARISKDVRRAVGKGEPHAGVIDQRQALLALGQMCADHAGDRIAIGEADAGKPDADRLRHQFFRMRRATQEREIRGGGEFDITHGYSFTVMRRCFLPSPTRGESKDYANVPCRNQLGGAALARSPRTRSR